MSIIDIGDLVDTKHGTGIVRRIDDYTFSIIMYDVLLITGRFKGEILYISDLQSIPEIKGDD